MKIEAIHYLHLRNDEHFQFNAETKDAIYAAGATQLKINLLVPAYHAAFAAEDESIKKILISTLTIEIDDYDNRRDNTFRGLKNTALAALDHYDPNIAAAAKRLQAVFHTYGNVSKKPKNEETAAIFNMIEDLKSAKYSADLDTAGLRGWVNQLDNENKALERLMQERYDETAEKTHLKVKECRADTDKAYHDIIERINALIVVEGETAYSAFVNKMNAIIEKYNNIMAQRAGRHKKKKEEEEKKKAEEAGKTEKTEEDRL